MSILTEESIVALAVGKEVDFENLEKCAWKNGGDSNYVVYSSHFLYESNLLTAFGVTPALKDTWERRGIEFNIYLSILDGKIASCSIEKTSETTLSARGCTNTLKPTQQELRVARRIVQYVTNVLPF